MLIITLWVLFLLAMLAVVVAAQASAHLVVAERIRDRLQAYGAARAAVARAVMALGLETNAWDALTERWANSPSDFQDVPCGDGIFSVIGMASNGTVGIRYGAMDESARVDLNGAHEDVLVGLLMTAGDLEERLACVVASNLVAARFVPGDGRTPPEWRPFRCPQDVLAVPGIDEALFFRLEPYVTVQGGGRRVNINTADEVVLESLMRRGGALAGTTGDAIGSLIRKVLQFREGGGIFTSFQGSELLTALSQRFVVEGDEGALLAGLEQVVMVNSERFRIVGVGTCRRGGRLSRRIECVWNREKRTFEFWHED